ncbi:uncharacterized protein L3040_005234 [Drepanopeziza brunnea f. sp. 'multigermtubi']|uniref:uncharacterized protein n=1 Tax=Drepanopeziza brunnea f. sp. 'multigermtubi' TaxID=698441 RepID=UPI0023A12D12|nr:hypothetical protein L3040_005234 [Drepanopeziza brunnea f. sp. 'multigermtubi']
MWILDCDGDVFGGRRLWLRPGKSFMFGRTKSKDATDHAEFALGNKTISRQHLLVKVDPIQPIDCARGDFRSKLTLIEGCGAIENGVEKGTKIGTLLNGEQIRAKTVVLDRDENVLKLGRFEVAFRLTWVPFTFTFSFSTAELKTIPYPSLRERLAPLDIRVLDHFERGYVTHVVAKKRNTSKGLQALVNGKYIVHNDSFLQALVAAATSSTPDGPAPLEEDFDNNLPDPLNYLPARGAEQTQQSAEAYAPDPARKDMFEGYTFVFYNKQQFDQLLAPITEGRGKALLRQAIPHETTVDEFVKYVKQVAGEKGLGEFEDGSEGKGVVVVRFNAKKGDNPEWYADFGQQVSLRLDHRLIEQSDFLDAILGKDASVLRRPLLDEPSGVTASPPTAASVGSPQTLQNSAPAPTPVETAPPEPPKRGRRRAGRAKFNGFEDDFTGPISSSMVEPDPEPIPVNEPLPEEIVYSQSLFVSQNPDQEISQAPEPEVRTSQKRRVSQVLEEEEEEEEIAPVAAALKRRRLATEADRRRKGELTPPPAPPPPKAATPSPVAKKEPATKGKSKRIKKEEKVDIIEVARQKRELAEAEAKAERESIQPQDSNIDIKNVQNLTLFGEMPLRTKPAPKRTVRADESENWENRWTHLKNFKKFRRRPGDDSARGFDKVIVPLEVVKTKDFGLGDGYWENEMQRKKKGKGKETQDMTQVESQRRPQEAAVKASRKILASEPEDSDQAAAGAEVISESEDEVVAPVAKGRATRAHQQQILAGKTSKSQDLPAATSQKRVAATTLTKPALAKKAKVAAIRKQPEPEEQSDDGSSDDGLKFRFKKKKA